MNPANINTLRIYTKPNCGFCVKAKTLAQQHGISYEEVHLDVGQPRDSVSSYITREELLSKLPLAKTMPQIEVNGIPIGGYTEFAQLMGAGR